VPKWLVAGVIEDGRRIASERGCPQGAVISPVLANIYLQPAGSRHGSLKGIRLSQPVCPHH
jgi:retron-type reverse transcriptase